MHWRIEQEGEYLWAVRKGDEKHWAMSAEDAVKLLCALEGAGW